MNLRGIDFHSVFTSSGARGFFGEGYPYHALPPWRFINYCGSSFVSKTATLEPRTGNMPVREDGRTPRNFKPKCILVNPRIGSVLNAVGLSNPGILALLEADCWQHLVEPFFISFMPVSQTKQERLDELAECVALLASRFKQFMTRFALEINYSCPNAGLHQSELVEEVGEGMQTASKLGVPVIANFNLLLPAEKAGEISRHTACDAISIANSLPWGSFPELVNWRDQFGTEISPLARLGGGGLSGAPLLPVLLRWLSEARAVRISKPVIAGGGIMNVADAEKVLRAGFPIVSALKIGVAGLLRPWNVAGIIRCGNENIGQRPAWSCA